MDLMSIGLTGLRSASQGVATAANNVANANTPDYKAQRAGQVRTPEPGEGTGNDVDLAGEITELNVQSGVYKANLKVIQTAAELLGSALDMKA